MSLTILGVDPGSRISRFWRHSHSEWTCEHVNHGVILLDATPGISSTHERARIRLS